jgi:hypothetical protein
MAAADDRSSLQSLLRSALEDYRNGWSIGTFGAIGEFSRDRDEPVEHAVNTAAFQVVSARGAIRLVPVEGLQAFAYDTLSGDGATWGNAIAFCLPVKQGSRPAFIKRLGADSGAVRIQDRDAILYDLGIGLGHVSMCARTLEPELVWALDGAAGQGLFTAAAQNAALLIQRLSPNRVLISPAGRVEVYADIPPPNGKSPDGPHTHLLPKLIASSRTHSANAPIPEGWQPVLMLHPRSPWRDARGRRTPYDAELDTQFDRWLARFGLEQDRRIRIAVEMAIEARMPCQAFALPTTRRERIEMRITLRRLAQKRGADAVADWRERFDAAALAGDA